MWSVALAETVLLVNLTSSETEQPPLEIVHLNIFSPKFNELIVASCWAELLIIPDPLNILHAPVPAPGSSASITCESIQIVRSIPAYTGNELLFTVTWSSDTQIPLVIVQVKTVVEPTSTVTCVSNCVGCTIIAVPLKVDHTPVPTIGELPRRVVVWLQIS